MLTYTVTLPLITATIIFTSRQAKYMYNYTLMIFYVQVSGVSSSPELSNRERFKYYFQLSPPDDDLAVGFFAIVRRYRWRHVAIIEQEENIFTAVSNKEVK